MAEQQITLTPGESKVVSFEIIPAEIRTYQVSLNGLTGSFVAALAAKFEYVSDIRWTELTGPAWGFAIEVDIKNTGSVSGTCHPIATLDLLTSQGWAETGTVDMGTQTINPGQTVTFKGNWVYAFGPSMPAYSYILRNIVITSEAGAISSVTGVALVTVDIPAQILSGSEFWATMKITLAADSPNRVYGPRVTLKQKEYPYRSSEICSATIAPAGLLPPSAPPGIILDRTGEYQIRGLYYADVGGGPVYSHPAKATYIGYENASYWGEWPLPAGKYDVMCWLMIGTYGVGGLGFQMYWAFQELKVGEVQIV